MGSPRDKTLAGETEETPAQKPFKQFKSFQPWTESGSGLIWASIAPEILQVKKSLGVLVEDFFFDFLR